MFSLETESLAEKNRPTKNEKGVKLEENDDRVLNNRNAVMMLTETILLSDDVYLVLRPRCSIAQNLNSSDPTNGLCLENVYDTLRAMFIKYVNIEMA